MFENIDNDNKILVITPSYPSLENKYLCGFVHSRLKSYKDHGINFDVVCCHNYNGICKYNYEGIDVLRVNFSNLRHILQHKKYDKILVHFLMIYMPKYLMHVILMKQNYIYGFMAQKHCIGTGANLLLNILKMNNHCHMT